MKTHKIINQNGDIIYDDDIRDEVKHALDHAMYHTYFDGKRIDIVEDKNYTEDRVTLVKVEF